MEAAYGQIANTTLDVAVIGAVRAYPVRKRFLADFQRLPAAPDYTPKAGKKIVCVHTPKR
jgi:hypothetical protein